MKQEDFFKQFSIIENHLTKLADNFDKRQGFLSLLKYLQSKNLLPQEVLTDLNFVWQTRNKIVSSPNGEQEISDEISNRLAQIKSKLGL
jgi:hypothetical protein